MAGLWGAKCREVKVPAVAHLVSPGAHAFRAVELKCFQGSDVSRALQPHGAQEAGCKLSCMPPRYPDLWGQAINYTTSTRASVLFVTIFLVSPAGVFSRAGLGSSPC